MSAGGSGTLNFNLSPVGTITGTVYNVGTGANVGSSDSVGCSPVEGMGTTNTSGVYTFSNVPVSATAYTITPYREDQLLSGGDCCERHSQLSRSDCHSEL